MTSKAPLPIVTVTLTKIVGGGQALGTMDDGRKIFVWGGLPDETVEVQLTKKKSKLAEGYVTNVIKKSKDHVELADPDSYLSTSPWQIMSFEAEQRYKQALIKEAFELQDITLQGDIDVYTDQNEYNYRNKVEFSFYWDKETRQLDLAFYRRGSHEKIIVHSTELAHPNMNKSAQAVLDLLIERHVGGYNLKTLLLRSDAEGNVIAQLYVKDENFKPILPNQIEKLGLKGFEVIYSNPKSPASVITSRLQKWGSANLSDTILGIPFSYATEGFFQINLSVYEQALKDMKESVTADKPVIDLYSGVGTIGLTIGGDDVTLVEMNESAVREMKQNIAALGKSGAKAVLAPTEKALDYIKGDSLIIVDPPRAGLHKDVIEKLLAETPDRIIYLSCNPVTQARDIMLLQDSYNITSHKGYNFFPRTPHIEHLVILDKK